MKMLSQLLSTISNLNAKSKMVAFAVIFAVLGTTVFQNCAKGKFNLSPEQVQQLAQAYCQGGVTTSCANETGTGLQCSVANTEAAAGVCVFQSCNPGYRLVGNLCTPTACTPNSVASCTYTVERNLIAMAAGKLVSSKVVEGLSPLEGNVALGQGTMVCNSEGTGYGACTPVVCETIERPFDTKLGGVVARTIETPSSSSSSPFPSPSFPSPSFPSSSSSSPSPAVSSSSPSPSYSSPSPSPTPSPSPSIVEFCKYSCAQGTEICAQAQRMSSSVVFEPVCTEGSAAYFERCDVVACGEGYTRVDNMIGGGFSCYAQTCTPGATAQCTDGPGHGTATCDTLGLEYGSCQITSCDAPYKPTPENGACVLDEPAIICEPGTYNNQTCTAPHGSGIQRCNGAGTAYDCQMTTCDEGYNSWFASAPGTGCVANICQPGTNSSCTVSNGVGTKSCEGNGAYYTACGNITCNPGYSNYDGQCLACEPNSIITDNSCTSTLPNGVSNQRVCSADGSSSTCRTTGCETGYSPAYGADGIASCYPTPNTKVAPKKK